MKHKKKLEFVSRTFVGENSYRGNTGTCKSNTHVIHTTKFINVFTLPVRRLREMSLREKEEDIKRMYVTLHSYSAAHTMLQLTSDNQLVSASRN